MVSRSAAARSRTQRPILFRTRPVLVLAWWDLLGLAVVGIAYNRTGDTRSTVVGAIGVLATLVVLEAVGLYRPRLTLSALDEIPRLAGWTLIVSGVVYAVALPDARVLLVIAYAATVFVVLFAVRVFYYAFLRHRRRTSSAHRRRAAVFGSGLVAAELIEATRSRPDLGIDVVLAVSDDPMPELVAAQIPIQSGLTQMRDAVQEHRLDAILVAFSATPDSRLVTPLRMCDELDCEIFIVPRLFEFVPTTVGMDRIHTIPLTRVRRDALRTWYWKLKRAFDVCAVSSALVALSPVLATVAAVVYLTDTSAPIIFRQQRIGRNGQLFDLLKFRSMKPAAAQSTDSEWRPADADRIGRVGRVLRKTSLDELPQLWNVLRGDMSIVGPRPERPHFVEQFTQSIPSYQDRHRVPVGLTGWAAIHGLRGDTSITDRALYDNYYIQNWSVWLDLKIILLTIGAVLRGTGS